MSHFPDWERQGDGLVFRGTHYLVVSKKRDGMRAVRSLMDEASRGRHELDLTPSYMASIVPLNTCLESSDSPRYDE